MNNPNNGLSQLMAANAPQSVSGDHSQLKQIYAKAMQDPKFAMERGLNSYSAMTKLQELTAMEQAGANQQALQGGTQPSVAERTLAEAGVSPQGIAGIPVSNVGSEEAYAAGGIIAFDDGGEVPSYAEGRRVSGSEQYALERARAEKERELAYAKIQDAILSRTGTPSSWQYGLTGGALGSPYEPAVPGAEAGYKKQLETQADAINRAKYAGTMLETGPMAGMLPQTNVTPLAMTPSMPASAEIPLPPVDMRVPVEQANLSKGIVEGKFNVPTVPKAQPTTSTSGLKAPVIPYTPMAEADMTPAGNSRASMQEYQDLIGVDPYAAKAKERLGAMEQANELYKQQYPWMALAEAGFGMAAGKSPYALSNIAEGGMKGMAALGAGRKEFKDQQEKVINAEAKVAEAERAVQLKAAEFGVNDSRTKEAARRLEKAEDRKNKLAVSMKNTELAAETGRFNVTEARQSAADRATAAYRGEALDVERERNKLTKEGNVQNKTVEMYNKARDNAQSAVDKMLTATGQVSITPAEYENLIAVQYAKELKNVGLPPIASPAGFTVKKVRDN